MIVEMRVYYCAPTRLPALLERFRNTTLGFSVPMKLPWYTYAVAIPAYARAKSGSRSAEALKARSASFVVSGLLASSLRR